MSKSSHGPSMHDVAQHAGVSHQTVSRVLNGFDGIRPATRARVLEAINALGYRRNLAARTLVTGRSNAIGMIGPEIPDIGPLSSLHAVERAAREVGMHTLMTTTSPDAESVEQALEFLLGRGIDALVLVAQYRDVEKAAHSVPDFIPTVYLLTGGEPRGASIAIDQGAGVLSVMEHLAGLGHRRIQHISGPLTYTEAQLRRDAFSAFVTAAGFDELPILEGDWTTDSGYEAGQRIDPNATAVFCANDQMAFGLIHALADAGRSVPSDISVVGFDDTSEARHAVPPLTTIHQDFGAVGRLAVDVLMSRLSGTPKEEIDLLVPWIVERQSTAPPRRS